MPYLHIGQPLQEQPSAFQSLASGLGQGIGGGLQALANMKLNQIQSQYAQQARQSQLAPVLKQLGLPQEYAALPDDLLQQVFKQQQQQQLAQSEFQTLQSLLGQQSGVSQQASMGGQPQMNQGQQIPTQAQALPSTGMLTPGKALPTAQFLEGRRQFEQKEGRIKTKDIREALKPIREVEQSADKQIDALDRLVELSDQDLRSGTGQQLLSKAGLGNLWLNPASQEAQAISNKLVVELAEKLKGNLSDKDILFLKQSVPTLFNSPDGIKRIAKMMKLGSQGEKAYAEEFRNIVKKEGGLSVDSEDRAYAAARKKQEVYKKKILNEIESGSTKQISVGQEFEKLPQPSLFGEGAEIESSTGQKMRVVNGKWKKV